ARVAAAGGQQPVVGVVQDGTGDALAGDVPAAQQPPAHRHYTTPSFEVSGRPRRTRRRTGSWRSRGSGVRTDGRNPGPRCPGTESLIMPIGTGPASVQSARTG